MLSEKLKTLRQKKGLSQVELSNIVGISNGLYNKYEKKGVRPPYETLIKIAHALEVPINELLNSCEEFSSETVIEFPVLGSVKAGINGNIINEEEPGETRTVATTTIHGRPQDYFILRVRGNSMYPEILDGDCVLVHKTPSVESGSMAVVLYNSDYATVKWVRYVEGENWVELIPNNPQYAPIRIENEDLEQCCILGEVVDIMRKPRKKTW